MSIDDLIRSIERALAAGPQDIVLRVHAAQLLLEANRAAESLDHVKIVLAIEPDNLEALRVASAAAAASGDTELAAKYEHLAASLGDETSPEEQPLPVIRDDATSPANAPSEEDVFRALGDEMAYVDSVGDLGEVFSRSRRPETRLDDVGGLEEVKTRLEMAFLGPMRNEELRKSYGKSLRGGLMLYGPPGCGKTFVARALAGELGARFLSVGLVDILDMWLGNSEKNVHEMFQVARRSAPCVLFLDELDAIGQKRTQFRGSAGRGVVNQLLQELDDIKDLNKGVFVLGATNSPWDIDPALRRPGRFDRTVLVSPPDLAARVHIIDTQLKKRPHDGEVDLAHLARRTRGYSGADLAHLVDTASERALDRAIRADEIQPITSSDFVAALKEVRPSTGPWFSGAKNFVLFANEGGVYDDLLHYMEAEKML